MIRGFKYLLGAATAAAVFTGAANAAVISVNFGADVTSNMMRTTDIAGVGDARAINWNNIIGTVGATGASTGIRTTPDGLAVNTPASLIDSAGSLTGAQIAYTYSATSSQTTNNASGLADDQRMFGRYHETQWESGGPGTWTTTSPFQVSVTGVPYAEYDVYVYITTTSTGAGANRVGRYLLDGQDFYVRQFGGTTWTQSPWPDYYDQGTDTTPTASGNSQAAAANQDTGNYVRFTSLTGSNFTLDFSAWASTTTTARGPIAGIQIVEVPEPASLALLGLGTLMIVRRRR